MHAEFFSVDPQEVAATSAYRRSSMEPRFRQFHRWVSVVFTLTVAANFTAMIWGPPPAVITYSPLPPLLLLAITGLYMLAKHIRRARQARRPFPTKG